MTQSRITVEVVYAARDVQTIKAVELPVGATVAQAIGAAGMLAQFPEIDLSRQALGIFGSRVGANDSVANGDRVEIYRSLQADPKEMRRQRARKPRRLGSAHPGGRRR